MSEGPCQAWITGADVADCCTATDSSSDLDGPAETAGQILYQLSGGLYPGECERTVRPCDQRGCLCTGRWDGRAWTGCGCRACHLSRVTLAGTPVRTVSQVKIDGAVVNPDTYRLDHNRYLTRLADTDGNRQWWPRTQRLDLADTAESTFTVTYTYGADPTQAAIDAAVELACEIFQACQADTGGDCALPSGIIQVTRQGITYELAEFRAWGRDPATGAWRTGLPLVDAFLNTVNPHGRRRRPAIWSPDLPAFPQQVG